MSKKLTLILTLIVGFALNIHTVYLNYLDNISILNDLAFAQSRGASSLINKALTGKDESLSPEDAFCKSKIFTTVSKETCLAACPGAPLDCVRVQTYNKDFNPELKEDLDCFVCDSSYSCYDMGLIYGGWDCLACEANPDKECVSGFPTPLGGSIGLPLDSDGFQCWDCVNRPDTCFKHWPGSTIKATCDRACRGKPNHKCVKVGVNPDDGRGCYACLKNPPPPPTCHDVGLLFKRECGTCPPASPVCEVAVGAGFLAPAGQPIVDPAGNTCYECNPKPKTCEQQGLKSKCAADEIPTVVNAPNGKKCFTCAKKPQKCKDIHPSLREPPCQCKAGENPLNLTVGDKYNNDVACCKCIPDACHPNLNPKDCPKCEAEGGVCRPITRERGKPPCYRCVKRDKREEPKTCEDIYMHDSCRPNPCSESEECEMTDVTLQGKKTKCAECIPKDVDPTPCETHTNTQYPYHRFPNCAPCFNAQMACDTKQVSTNPALSCAKCLEPVDRRCEPPLLPGQCLREECSEGMKCTNVGNNCHTCEPKKGCKELELPVSCSSTEKCRSVVAENGEECCQCSPKTCVDMSRAPQRVCSTCSGQEECQKDGQAPSGEQCWKCIPKEVEPPEECPGGLSCTECRNTCEQDPTKQCRPSYFNIGNEDCCVCESKEVKDPCEDVQCPSDTECKTYECKEGECIGTIKTGSCDDKDECTNEDMCQRDGRCVGQTIPGCKESADCARVVPGSTANANCNGACPAELCESTPVYGNIGSRDPAYYCYKCKEGGCKSDSDCDDGLFCNGTEVCTGGECGPGDPPCPSGTCSEAQDKCLTCEGERLKSGGCPASDCKDGEERCNPINLTPSLSCHTCDPLELTENQCRKKDMLDGVCPTPDPCQIGYECKQERVNGEMCHGCYPIKYEPKCPQGTQPGTCVPGLMDPCQPDGACTPRPTEFIDCYSCRPVTGGDGSEPIGSIPGGGEQIFEDGFESGDTSSWGTTETSNTSTGGTAIREPITTGLGGGLTMGCQEPHMSWAACLDDCPRPPIGSCKPVPGSLNLTSTYTPMCYTCVENVPRCPQGQVSTCGICKPNERCIPGALVSDPQSPGEVFVCKMCVPRDRVVEVTYLIIIIETPRGRYILGDRKGTLDLGDFKASQVMQLAKAGSAEAALQQIGSMLPAGGFNIPGIISGGMSMGNLTSLLQQSMEDGKSFGDNCFEKQDEFAETALPSSPPSSSGSSESSSGKSPFGQDASKEIPTDGPMVACGEKDGQKALAIMDSHGRVVQYIFEDTLMKDPSAIQTALMRAQTLSDTAADLAQGNWQGILKKAQQKVISKITSTIDTTVTDFVEPDGQEDVQPNDPFYRPPEKEKKKKKLLGILGSSKKANIMVGSGMKMGKGIALGGSEGKYDNDKEEEMDWQWGVHRVGFTPLSDPNSAWHLVEEDKKNVIVAVIDSGLDMAHKDGPRFIWTNEDEIPGNGIDDDQNGYVDDVHGWNFLGNNNDLTDEQGHGSFVSGIIAAKTNNGFGMAGINPGAVIMPVKVADKEGQTNSFMITRAIYYAVDNGADVINISLGAAVRSRQEEAAFRYAHQRGVFIAAAAGNIGEDIQDHGPASAEGAFAVGSLDFENNRSTISNWGANNGLLAPGDRIISLIATGAGKGLSKSTLEAGFYPQSGTSFSTPIVAATASLLLSQNPELTNLEIEDILHRTADDIYEPGWDEYSGAGVLNAKAALSANVNSQITAKLTEIKFNFNDRKKLESADIYATVRGDFKSFVVELGKGKRAKKFDQVAGPYTGQASHDFVARLFKKEHLKGSRDWIVRIVVTNKDGSQTIAQTPLSLR